MNKIFCFDEKTFVNHVDNIDPNPPWCADWKEQINNVRAENPEISHWREQPLGFAIGNYSRDILEVGWADWVRGKNRGLIAYIYIKQKCPGFDFGSNGNYSTNLWDYSETLPWLNDAPLPEWVNEQFNQRNADLRERDVREFIELIASYAGNYTVSDAQHETINYVLNLLPDVATLKDKLSSCLTEHSNKLGLTQKLILELEPLQSFIKKAIAAQSH